MDLHAAIARGNKEAIAIYLNGENVDVISADAEGKSLLHTACAYGQTEIMDILCEHDALINFKDHNGDTPLLIAINAGHSNLAKILLEEGAHPKIANNDGFTPLHSSSSKGMADLVKFLIKLGADVNAASVNKSCPIHLATFSNHTQVLLNLLEAGANVNVLNVEGMSPLTIALLNKHDDCMFALLACGADFNTQKNANGETAMDFAIQGILTGVQDILNAVQVQRLTRAQAFKSLEVCQNLQKQLGNLERREVQINHFLHIYQQQMPKLDTDMDVFKEKN